MTNLAINFDRDVYQTFEELNEHLVDAVEKEEKTPRVEKIQPNTKKEALVVGALSLMVFSSEVHDQYLKEMYNSAFAFPIENTESIAETSSTLDQFFDPRVAIQDFEIVDPKNAIDYEDQLATTEITQLYQKNMKSYIKAFKKRKPSV